MDNDFSLKRLMQQALLAVFVCAALALSAQTGFHIPNGARVKDAKKAMHNPETFALLLQCGASDSVLSLSHLDWLDSSYAIAFDINNPRLYTIRIEAFAADTVLANRWVTAVADYYAHRSRMPFPIRYAYNPIHCSCMGDTTELVRFEVPVTTGAYAMADLPDSRRKFNKTISLDNAILITFKHNPDACLGAARGCFVPAQDSTIRGYYTSLFLSKGALYAVENTKDSCNISSEVVIDEHFDYRSIVERYFLVPHPKNIIVQAGYVVFKPDADIRRDSCLLPFPDSITVQFPATEEQIASKIRIFAKVYSEKGVEYKALATKKVKTKGSDALHIKANLNLAQLDTLYLGKRIRPDEIDDYFYEVKSDRDVGAFTIGKRHYMAYKLSNKGEYKMKRALRDLFRIVPDEEEMPAERLEDDDL